MASSAAAPSPEAAAVYARVQQLLSGGGDACTAGDGQKVSAAFLAKLRHSIDILEKAYKIFGIRGVVGSFNGGKEACAIAYLQQVALLRFLAGSASGGQGQTSPTDTNSTRGTEPAPSPPPAVPASSPRMEAVYFVLKDDFEEVQALVESISSAPRLNMALEKYDCGWQEGISARVNRDKGEGEAQPPATCFVLGTRETDPNAGAAPADFEPSSSWIKTCTFMRCNPVLRWSYHDVWVFLKEVVEPCCAASSSTPSALPFCSLYLRGYTSLGTRGNTRANPALLKDESTGEYRPAWELEDGARERDGRISSSGKK